MPKKKNAGKPKQVEALTHEEARRRNLAVRRAPALDARGGAERPPRGL